MYKESMVSIIMPAFNSSLTIEKAINSVLCQSYTNWELLVCDDFSDDDTKLKVRQFEDERITIMSNRFDKGVVGARNSSLEMSRGQYVAFLDSDDYWSEDKLEKQVAFLKANNFYFTFSDYYLFDTVNSSTELPIYNAPNRVSFEDALRSCSIGCLTVLIDRYKTGAIFMPNSEKEDYASWLLILKEFGPAYKTPGTLGFYRLSLNSLSGNKLREVFKQWDVLRQVAKQPLVNSLFYIGAYILLGFKKHFWDYRH